MDAFPADYFNARERFRAAARACGAGLLSHTIAASGPRGESLTMDVAILGSATSPRTLVVSSGLHGVEGFAGSAVQFAWMGSLAKCLPAADLRIVLIHALNPWGFAWLRRVNERNVDLNRNFLAPGEAYAGAPDEVRTLADFIAPDTPPDPPWLAWRYWPQAARVVARHGMGALRTALTRGQYEYPQGLFYGGREPEESTIVVRRHYEDWTGRAEQVLHLDLHTGLGPSGQCTLLAGTAPRHAAWLRPRFAGFPLQAAACGLNTAVSGGMGDALSARFAAQGRLHLFATVEFGTCGSLSAFRALREENRAHRFAGHPGHETAKRRLLQCFCPDAATWRANVLRHGMALMRQALHACHCRTR